MRSTVKTGLSKSSWRRTILERSEFPAWLSVECARTAFDISRLNDMTKDLDGLRHILAPQSEAIQSLSVKQGEGLSR